MSVSAALCRLAVFVALYRLADFDATDKAGAHSSTHLRYCL